ncbi:membrane protein insertion efficiency factor YidD [Aristophania vespae]|uniref:Putative membrane protein insertion efficiency factor n=1 Tax=Aristophania vespae TaxID=2697033 RepID=A0A6P1N9T3_9PROT|nr:membrane protein insertion efficiency factor YidD [Aristophania vespae]QHI95345.1 membrane protein insertion efficiency factor YidD [Aristophania vespae]UMM64613.1 Putative membrane protein insertion efficiency factor [Aristophania vespae]
MRSVLTFFFLFLIKLYQITISPFIGRNCRFYPTCSAYAVSVISRYGPFYGGWLTLKRLLKCHPFHKGGFDPPP